MRRIFLILTIAAFCPAVARAQLNAVEKQGLDNALYVANLTARDLLFEKKLTDDRYRLPLNTLALDDPLVASERLQKLHVGANSSLYEDLREANRLAFDDATIDNQDLPTLGPVPEDVPEALREPMEILLGAIDESNRSVHQAIAKLTETEQRELIESLPVWCAANRQVRFGFTERAEASQDRVLELLDKVDLPAIRAAGVKLSYVVESQLPEIKKLAATTHIEKSLRFVIRGYRVELSAENDALHASRDTNLCIGLGDRNRYIGRFGSGIGYSSVLIDCGNQNYYDVPDLSVGVGLLGVGLAYITGNGDAFHGGSVCFGAGLAGVGAAIHEGNDSSFKATALSEGFGSFGDGLLVDNGDRNSFHGELFTQGAARTQGVGWLIEEGATDTFVAGGISQVEGKNAPISQSQGYAAGSGSEDALLSGGVGLMTTFGQGQTYIGGIRCQGAAVWGGVGSLMDKGARSTHSATQEAHAYANHQAAAFVFNYGGFGSYTARFGTCQSCAADSSVTLVLDRGGHDLYSSKDGRPAMAMRNSVALFLTSGQDNSFIAPAASSSEGQTGIGIFCDLGAGDEFTASRSFAPVQVQDSLFVFFQDEHGPEVGPVSSERTLKFAPGSEPNPGESQLAAEWKRATSGGADAPRALNHLIAIGPPAADFVFKQELGNSDPAVLSTEAQLVAGIGDDARKILSLEISSNGLGRCRNALRVACLAPGRGMDQAIVSALSRSPMRRLAAKAAGLCRVEAAVSQLQPLCADSDPGVALAALVALSQIGDPASAGTAAACLTSDRWGMRRAAIALISQFPKDAIVAASGLIASSNEQARRTGVQVIAGLNTPEGFRRLGHLLNDPSPGVQLQVLVALQGHVPDELKAQVADLQQSPDLFVRKMVEGMQVDR
jgi:hypothetical protein